jgi:hypothetical protein
MQEFSGALLGGLAAAIVARGGLDLGMPGKLLDRTQICARVQQISDERPSCGVWRKRRNTRLNGSAGAQYTAWLGRPRGRYSGPAQRFPAFQKAA